MKSGAWHARDSGTPRRLETSAFEGPWRCKSKLILFDQTQTVQTDANPVERQIAKKAKNPRNTSRNVFCSMAM
jgi:hypothetical protein